MVAATTLSPPTGIEFTNSPVEAGGEVTVKVTAAPCHPVEVVLTIAGVVVAQSWITEAPGDCRLPVPEFCAGLPFTIEIKCPNDRTTSQGIVS
jgi:hypothetical protein